MEENNNHHEDNMGYGGWNKYHGHGHFMLIRLILGIIILAIVFVVGMKIGEFKGEYGSGYGRHGMMMRGFRGDYYGGGYGVPVPMMQGRAQNLTPATPGNSAPSTNANTPTK